MPESTQIHQNTAPQSIVPPMGNVPEVNVVPPLGATGEAPATSSTNITNFQAILSRLTHGPHGENHGEKPSVPPMAEPIVPPMNGSAPKAGGLQSNRIRIAEEIGKAVRRGDIKKLHALQSEYDTLTAQLRSQAELAFTSHTVAHAPEPPLPMPAMQPHTEAPVAAPLSPASNEKTAESLPKKATPPSDPAAKTTKPEIKKTATVQAQAHAPKKANAPVPPLVHIPETHPIPAQPTPIQESPASPLKTSSQIPKAKLSDPQGAEAMASKPKNIVLEPVTASTPKAGVFQIFNAHAPEDKPVSGNPFGVPEAIWDKVCRNPEIKSALLSLPQSAIELYKQITPKEKQELAERLNQKTHIFFFTIDNRKAFIDGKVMGHDAFQYMQDAIDKQVFDGKITLEASLRQKSALNILRGLSPEQREGFVALVDTEVNPSKN